MCTESQVKDLINSYFYKFPSCLEVLQKCHESRWRHEDDMKDVPLQRVLIALNAATERQTWPLEFWNC